GACFAPPPIGGNGAIVLHDDARDGPALTWRWATDAVTYHVSDFGDPRASIDYTLCVYDEENLPFGVRRRRGVVAALRVPAGISCGDAPCWSSKRDGGFGYRDRAGAADGVRRLVLRRGRANEPSLLLDARGRLLEFRNPPLA